MSSGRRMVVVSATKNEVRNVPLVLAELAGAVDELDELGVSIEVMVVDDDSVDGTREALKCEAELRGVALQVIDGPNQGLSGAVITGLRAALDASPDLVCLLDFDGQHDALQIPKLVRVWLDDPQLGAVFGSRFQGGAEFVGVTRTRKVLSHGSRFALRGATRMRIPSDPTTSFRVSTPQVIRAFLHDVPVRRLDGYQFFFWFAVFTAARFQFADVPIRFRPRLMGTSHLSLRDVLRAARSLPEVASRSREWRRHGVHHDGFPEYPTEYLDGIAEIERYTQWIADCVAPYLRGNVLELGAGTGTMTELFAKVPGVASIVAVEPDEARCTRLAAHLVDRPQRVPITALHGTIADVDGRFEAVVYCNSLEHIADLRGELHAARAKLSPDGVLVVFGPGHEALYGPLDHMSGHWRRFSLAHLAADIESSGYQLVERRYLDPLGALTYLAGSKFGSNAATLTPFTLKVYERMVLPPSKALGPLTKKLFGKNVLVVARRAVDD